MRAVIEINDSRKSAIGVGVSGEKSRLSAESSTGATPSTTPEAA
jgi:hypothetical protein